MLLEIPQLISAENVTAIRQRLDRAAWADGRITAGSQSATVKRNQQLPEDSDAARESQRVVVEAISNSGLFLSAALPHRIFPPLFNRYEQGMDFGDHIDNAIRTHARSGQHLRTDISVTVFLADVDEYEGGELVIEDSFGVQTVKLAAGSAILYPASSLHRVNSVTRGARLASFFWVESRVRDAQRRRLLYEIDSAIASIRQANGESLEAIRLTGCYHNLLRMWDGT